jgi:STE24 endopeptidase
MAAFLKLLALEEYLPAYTQAGWRPEQVGAIPFMGLTIAFTVFIYLLEAYLDWRQLRTFYTTKALPKELVNHISDETFRKSNAYGKDKFSFKIIESGFMFIEGVAFIVLGYLPYAWDLSRSIAARMGVLTSDYSNLFQEIVITWVFIIVMSLVDTVISMPFSLYGTFVVEEKHGFNKTTLALFFQDKIMTLGLTFLLGMPILSLVIWIIRIGGPHFYYYVWACLCVVSIVLMTVYPTLIAPLFNKYTKLEDGEVKTAIEDLARSVEFPLTNLFTVDGSRRSAHSNAYFYGFFKVYYY